MDVCICMCLLGARTGRAFDDLKELLILFVPLLLLQIRLLSFFRRNVLYGNQVNNMQYVSA